MLALPERGSDFGCLGEIEDVFGGFGTSAGCESRAATLGDWEGVRSCILSPITAPIRHRNVQVMAIPILCSVFMRVLLCSDGNEADLHTKPFSREPQASTVALACGSWLNGRRDLTPVRPAGRSGRRFSAACTSATGRRPRPRNDRRCRPTPLPDAVRQTGPVVPEW